MSLCLVTIFKNEAHIMKEWVEHYINQDVDKIFMIDNDSNDNYLESLTQYIQNGKVELVTDKEKYAQEKCYNRHFLQKCKNYDWVIVCDLDEFIYARRGMKTMKDYVRTLDDSISQVFIPWKIFGSNGFNTLDKEQPTSVIQSFTKRINYDKHDGFQGVIKEGDNKYSLTKCIVRTKYLLEFSVHSHKTINQNHITSFNNIKNIHHNKIFCKIDENILKESYLHLNHYAIQSYKWFMNIKATRGDVNNVSGEKVRNEKYFTEFDNSSNDIDDFELYEKYYKK